MDAIFSATPFVVPVAEKNATRTSECAARSGVSPSGSASEDAFSVVVSISVTVVSDSALPVLSADSF